jgi:4'-phosphopantetheinyl transferase
MAGFAKMRSLLRPPAPGEAHVWKLDLGQAIAVSLDPGVLSDDERARAARLHFAADQTRSIVSRVALRELLARYVGVAPGALRFVAGPHGKPEIEPAIAPGVPRFNVAHSGRVVLLAFATCDVGVDVEESHAGIEVEELAQRFFSAVEGEALTAATLSERDQLFFRIWTRKEAFLKAHGAGLSAPLSAFSTTSRSGEPLRSILASGELPSGFLSDLETAAGYAGAVVTAEPARVVMRNFAEIPR